MGRLTFKNANGTWGLKNYDIKKVPSDLYGAICKLKDYENCGFSPNQLEELDMKWIDVKSQLPKDNRYILVSFENFSLPDIGRYEAKYDGGAFYPGDEDKSYVSYGLFVNAWMELPKPYRPED